WREHPEQPSAYLIRGAVDSDAPASPPEHTVIDVDEILQLAQRHAHAVGLTRLATLRPTHEDWAAGGTRIEQAISAVGSLDQVTAFGAALAGELQARLTRFDIESSEKGLVRVTASLDVLLRKETGR
ncbi:MAG: hypothetical protein HOH74_12005, partial [Gemmatimonadetes bacterium]|nr:hypothetical protein [Gemmatimonadota bacterium]